MKKKGIRLILSVILALTFVMVPFSNVVAAPPVKSWMNVTESGDGYIDFDYGWDKLNVYSYSVYVFESGIGFSYYFETENFGVRTRSKEYTGIHVVDDGIDSGDTLHLRLWPRGKNGKIMKNARIDMQVQVP